MPIFLSASSLKAQGAAPRYEQIANALRQAIKTGRLKPGERLPTVRQLASELGVSLTTVTAAFRSLAEDGLTRGEIGRGTYVERVGNGVGSTSLAVSESRSARGWPGVKSPWRRRALVGMMGRLRSTFPEATNCAFGGPDPSLLPLRLIKRHWKAVFDDVTNDDLQYKTADPVDALKEILQARLSEQGIPAAANDFVVGTSAQQFMALAAHVARRLGSPGEVVIAVEQPGYYTIFDTWDHAGVRLIGIDTDEGGARPEALEAAIRNGANAVLLTPRAQNPTGASWTPQRRQALGDVLYRCPHVVAIEDDHFADIAEAQAGSLLADPRVEDRVIYIRSFSKAIAPDLRLSVAAARPHLKSLLQEAKSHADGWSSRLLQRVLARVLQDKGLDSWLGRVRQTYRMRRDQVAAGLAGSHLPGTVIWPARDGVNLWIHLPSGVDATEVIERAAALGVLVAPGEVFYLSPGHSDVVRFNVGRVEAERLALSTALFARAVQQSRNSASTAIHV